MSYDSAERSVQDARVRELYDITTQDDAFYLTSALEDFEFGGRRYEATVLGRSAIRLPVIGGPKQELIVSMHLLHPCVQVLLGAGARLVPPRDPIVTIRRLIDGEARPIWKGRIVSCEIDEVYARLRVPHFFSDVLAAELPVAQTQRQCNHQLYDSGCRLAKFGINAIVIAVSGTTITLDAYPLLDGHADFGELFRFNDRERRSILTQVGTTITVDIPFAALAIGDAVAVIAGCDHTLETCRMKFNNVLNFGGHPDIPIDNPTAPAGLGVVVQV